MITTVKFHQVSQNPENSRITVDLSSSPSNRSCLKRRNIVIGGALGIGITAAAVTAYFFINKALTETEYSADPVESSMSESIQSLHNIVKLVTIDSNGYDNCAFAFQDHWERFKECGVSADECMRNSIKLFGKLFCKPPTNAFGYIDDTSEKCENNHFTLARCDI